MAGLFTFRVFARNLLKRSRQRNIFHISFLMTDLGYEPRLLHLISRHTTYQTTATSKLCQLLLISCLWKARWSLKNNAFCGHVLGITVNKFIYEQQGVKLCGQVLVSSLNISMVLRSFNYRNSKTTMKIIFSFSGIQGLLNLNTSTN